MTVVVGAYTKDKGIAVAADSETSGYVRSYRTDGKLFVSGRYLCGATGYVRSAQVFRYTFDIPVFRASEEKSVPGFYVAKVVPALRETLRKQGNLTVENGVDSFDAAVLVACEDHLVVIDPDFTVMRDVYGRTAVGSGAGQALGYLGQVGPWTEADVIEAARRARQTARGVGGPIWVGNTKDLTIRIVNDGASTVDKAA